MSPTLQVNAALDRDRVDAIGRAVSFAVDDAAKSQSTPWTADEISEALLIYLCQIMHGAPDERAHFVLADGAIEFVERNCGVDRMRLRMLRAAEHEGEDADTIGRTEGRA